MKAKIHPTYYNDAKVTCACGNTFITGSISQTINASDLDLSLIHI